MVASYTNGFFNHFFILYQHHHSHVEQPIRKESRILKATWKKEKKK
jgi:hypothetical protein